MNPQDLPAAVKKRLKEFEERAIEDYKEIDTKIIPFRRVMKEPQSALLPFRALIHSFKFGNYNYGLHYKIDLSESDQILFQEFIQRCSELAQFDPLWSAHSVNIHIDNEQGIDNTEFSIMSEADMRDLCLLFRKVYSDDEPGGNYRSAMNSLQRIIRAGDSEVAREIDKEFLSPFREAHQALKVRPFDYYWHKEIVKMPESLLNESIFGYTPEKLTSIMFYGHYIHKDRQRKEFEKIAEDPKILHHVRFRFLEQTSAQILIYLTLAEFILVLARGNGLKRPLTRDQHQTRFVFEG